MKNIVIGKYTGFCSGVKRCVSFVEKECKNNKTVYAFGELLHNDQEISRLEKMGLKVIKDVEEIEKASGVSVIIRTHGIEKYNLEKILNLSKNINVIDGTCPIVKKNQNIVEKYSKQNYNFIIYGDSNHPEIKALLSYIPKDKRFVVISSLDDVKNINFSSDDKIILLAQTTKPIEEYKEIIERLNNKYKNIKVFDTICKETILREKETEEISKKVETVIVVGGKNSANTKKLASIAKKYNNNVFVINSDDELETKYFDKYSSIGIVSGASTPYWLIQKIIDKLNKQQECSVI